MMFKPSELHLTYKNAQRTLVFSFTAQKELNPFCKRTSDHQTTLELHAAMSGQDPKWFNMS